MKKLRPKYKIFLIKKSDKVRKEQLKEKRIIYKNKLQKFKNRCRIKTTIKINAPETFFLGYLENEQNNINTPARYRTPSL
ncbi:hypothetical protein [Nitrosomonas sp.]|uniref:hypothetical protein n=1 Tax=Nitrosomonas sp. TaxID=42353 RepID=UPI001DC694DD|nr:hypothetical protein [Nitrosomonas sp.]MCB1948833.1 hypothetical protein [Nitrosomonas sp.]